MEEKVLLSAVLCFPVTDDKVLLGFKRDKIGANRWNGYGGGIEPGEYPVDAAVRELEQECGLTSATVFMEKAAIMLFNNQKSDGREFTCKVHVYLVRHWSGEPVATEEMGEPTWFKKNNLPFLGMMEADQFWLPQILEGKKIVGEAWYGPRQEKLLRPVVIAERSSFPRETAE
jgi:8-oxo-dGTP pyrophosphatase MutT (NUDIX family)